MPSRPIALSMGKGRSVAEGDLAALLCLHLCLSYLSMQWL